MQKWSTQSTTGITSWHYAQRFQCNLKLNFFLKYYYKWTNTDLENQNEISFMRRVRINVGAIRCLMGYTSHPCPWKKFKCAFAPYNDKVTHSTRQCFVIIDNFGSNSLNPEVGLAWAGPKLKNLSWGCERLQVLPMTALSRVHLKIYITLFLIQIYVALFTTSHYQNNMVQRI